MTENVVPFPPAAALTAELERYVVAMQTSGLKDTFSLVSQMAVAVLNCGGCPIEMVAKLRELADGIEKEAAC